MYKKKWLKIISEIAIYDSNLEKLQHYILGGGILSYYQEQDLLEKHKRSTIKKVINDRSSKLLDVDDLREMWKWANEKRKRKMKEDIERIGKYTAQGIKPTYSDLLLVTQYKLKMR